jgi:hypothetical protein
VLIDGVESGRTTETRFAPAEALADGMHTWQVIALDARGQERAGTLRRIGVDATGPRVAVRVSGPRRAGRVLRVRVRALDGRGSGVRKVVIRWGDGSRSRAARSGVHRYRAGQFRLRATATDRVGNRGSAVVRLRIRR